MQGIKNTPIEETSALTPETAAEMREFLLQHLSYGNMRLPDSTVAVYKEHFTLPELVAKTRQIGREQIRHLDIKLDASLHRNPLEPEELKEILQTYANYGSRNMSHLKSFLAITAREKPLAGDTPSQKLWNSLGGGAVKSTDIPDFPTLFYSLARNETSMAERALMSGNYSAIGLDFNAERDFPSPLKITNTELKNRFVSANPSDATIQMLADMLLNFGTKTHGSAKHVSQRLNLLRTRPDDYLAAIPQPEFIEVGAAVAARDKNGAGISL